MRLIDADYWIEKLNKIVADEDSPGEMKDYALFMISEIKAEPTACEANKDKWIPCSVRMPKEHDSMFAKFKGTSKWDDAMFEKISDVVNVAVADSKGRSTTTHAHTIDGQWSCDLLRFHKKLRIIAWMPLPEPPKEE